MNKSLRWLREVKLTTPPIGRSARRKGGYLLRRVQQGEKLSMPQSRAMPQIGRRVHELRIDDDETKLTWRIIYRTDPDAVLVVHWFEKKSQQTSQRDIDVAKRRLKEYDDA